MRLARRSASTSSFPSSSSLFCTALKGEGLKELKELKELTRASPGDKEAREVRPVLGLAAMALAPPVEGDDDDLCLALAIGVSTALSTCAAIIVYRDNSYGKF